MNGTCIFVSGHVFGILYPLLDCKKVSLVSFTLPGPFWTFWNAFDKTAALVWVVCCQSSNVLQIILTLVPLCVQMVLWKHPYRAITELIHQRLNSAELLFFLCSLSVFTNKESLLTLVRANVEKSLCLCLRTYMTLLCCRLSNFTRAFVTRWLDCRRDISSIFLIVDNE